MKKLRSDRFSEERALFASKDLSIEDSLFFDGESPLKESSGIDLHRCVFQWKYPLWYCKNIDAAECTLLDTARSGIWYTENINMTDCEIKAPKTFRRSSHISLRNVRMTDASETMWDCDNVELSDVYVLGDYFGMGCCDIIADRLNVDGNYLFDGGKNIVIKNSRLISKDAFWNCENVTVIDSVIVGEYLGWNSKNLTFINCDIESNQGMCYIRDLTMKGCRLNNTDLCFEYCTVDAEINSDIISVKNPISGRIVADRIGEIIMDPECVDVTKTEIIEVKK